MLASTLLSLGSIALGLVAWIVPGIAMGNSSINAIKKCTYYMIVSFSACVVSLCLQFFEIYYRVQIHDWSALMDIMGALAVVAAILGAFTIMLNIMALVVCIRKEREGK